MMLTPALSQKAKTIQPGYNILITIDIPESLYRKAKIRAADALHLACAAEHGSIAVYSNDLHFLLAAPLFGLERVNVISS